MRRGEGKNMKTGNLLATIAREPRLPPKLTNRNIWTIKRTAASVKDPDSLPPKPIFPTVITAESIAAYKGDCRVWDAARIKFGIATPEQVHNENSAIPRASHSRILHFSKHG